MWGVAALTCSWLELGADLGPGTLGGQAGYLESPYVRLSMCVSVLCVASWHRVSGAGVMRGLEQRPFGGSVGGE